MNSIYYFVSEQLESSNSQISFDEFIKENNLNKQKTLDFLNKKIIDFLQKIYTKKYQEKYGKLTNALIIVNSNSSAYYSLAVIIENKFYSISTYLFYNVESKKFSWKKYYVLFKTLNEKDYDKIAEGDKNKEFTINDKYGNLLKIKDILKHKNTLNSFKLRI